MKWHRNAYIELMTFGRVERPMFVELFGPLVGLPEEWQAQGATQDEVDMVAFDWDYVPVVRDFANIGQRGGYEEKVLEDTSEHLIQRDSMGRTTRLCKGVATAPLPMDYPVHDMDSWLKVKDWFVFHDDRIDSDGLEAAKKLQNEGAMVVGGIPGGFDLPRQLMGEEGACLCYYEQPELMHDILTTLTEMTLKVYERVSEKITIDQLSVHEDLAGKSGALVGPRQIAEFIKPYFQSVWDLLQSRGAKIFAMDTDGNVNSVIDAFLECGLTEIYPMEPAAGMDIVELRKKYGERLAFRGGIDKHVLRRTKREIRAELEYKMQPLMRQGGTVFGLDHRIPNGTPLDHYRYYVELGREILGLPRRDPELKGWSRMAF